MVASMLLLARPDAVGVPVVVRGGQYVAQVPEHVDLDEVSDANMYRDLPEPSVRNVPIDPLCVSTLTAAPPDVAPPVPPPAELPDFFELLQAAITSTTAAISAATRHKRINAWPGIGVTAVISFGPALVAGISKRRQ